MVYRSDKDTETRSWRSINHLINFIERKRKLYCGTRVLIWLLHASAIFFSSLQFAAWSLGAISQRVNFRNCSRRLIRERIGNKRERDRCPSICIARLSSYYHHTITQILAKEENAEYRRKARLSGRNDRPRSIIDLCEFTSKVVCAFWKCCKERVAAGSTWKIRKICATIISRAMIKIKW